MTQTSPPGFLDVDLLLGTSQPQGSPFRFSYGVAVFVLLMLMLSWAGAQNGAEFVALRVAGSLGLLATMFVMLALSQMAIRRNNDEQRQLQNIEELIQLRRWPEAAMTVQSLLSRPMRSQQVRVHALVFLSAILARYHRFEDAVAVHDYLLQHIVADDATIHALKIGRAMAILQEEHLFDADRAIADLRRYADRDRSAALVLLEIARDVKTGHPREAIDLFQLRLPILRQQLGHRVADAWALIARAYDLMDNEKEAQDAFERATFLAPMGELARRYQEVAALVGKYHPALAPPEAA